ncbi:hypothetical protein niasHT_007556 [Heterodera trifolii]|uniref:Uncharacterized protein n=1 Tax=Heterodera trifolii TaxID=157864 RepID=A0ABD2LPI2_9BILA
MFTGKYGLMGDDAPWTKSRIGRESELLTMRGRRRGKERSQAPRGKKGKAKDRWAREGAAVAPPANGLGGNKWTDSEWLAILLPGSIMVKAAEGGGERSAEAAAALAVCHKMYTTKGTEKCGGRTDNRRTKRKNVRIWQRE